MNNNKLGTQATIAGIHDVVVQVINRTAGDDFEPLAAQELSDAVAVEINNQLQFSR